MSFFSFTVPYRNFVTSVPLTYKPLVFNSPGEINKLLQNKILINQTKLTLTNEATEVLCLGLNFIPSIKDVKPPSESIARLIKDINTAIIFSKPSGHPHHTGWLSRIIVNEWKPENQSWMNDDKVIETLSELRTIPFLPSPVLHEKVLKEAKKLSQNTGIHIMKADKGRNTVIWSVEDYDREANRQLSDKSTYKELSQDEFTSKLKSIQQMVCSISENLLALRLITPTEDEAICNLPPTGSLIYFLPKIHKKIEPTSQTFPGRPIVATFTSVTYLLDKYVTELTSHLLKLIPGSLVDTIDFSNRLPTGSLPSNSSLVTADVTSLYPNIPWKAGIESSVKFYKENKHHLQTIAITEHKNNPPPHRLFSEILTLVLTNSMINFKNKRFFHQIKGTAMGCCISVYFANCYMYYTTQQIIHNPPGSLFLFLRFIDDLFFIINKPDDIHDIIRMISNDHINYEITPPSKTQNFLDTTVSISPKNIIILEPYSKDTASGAYLHPASTHPHHTINATPYSQLLRIRRISSDKFIFRRHARIMIRNFQTMGYDKKFLHKSFQKVYKLTEQSLTKKTNKSATAGAFKFITKFNKLVHWPKIQKTLNKLHSNILLHYGKLNSVKNQLITNLLTLKTIRLVLSNEKNLSSLFSPSAKIGHKLD